MSAILASSDFGQMFPKPVLHEDHNDMSASQLEVVEISVNEAMRVGQSRAFRVLVQMREAIQQTHKLLSNHTTHTMSNNIY